MECCSSASNKLVNISVETTDGKDKLFKTIKSSDIEGSDSYVVKYYLPENENKDIHKYEQLGSNSSNSISLHTS